MSTIVSRRDLLGIALAAGVVYPVARAASPGPKRLVAGTRVLEVNGRAAPVFGLTGPDGASGLSLGPAEQFRVALANEAGVPTLVHWHGQLPPWTQDGFPWPQTPPIATGVVQNYNYTPIAGTYWMHSHHDLQEQRLMTAPLIVHTSAEYREDRQEVVLMLHDFTFRSPDEVLADLTGTNASTAAAMVQNVEGGGARDVGGTSPQPGMAGVAAMPGQGQSGMTMGAAAMTPTAAMRMATTPTVPAPTSPTPTSMAPAAVTPTSMPPMDMAPTNMGAMTKAPMAMPGMATAAPGNMPMDLNDVHYDAFLANDRTLADPQVVRVEHGGRIRLRIINGASSSQFWIDLGALNGRVVATDGHPVRPVAGNRFPLAMAQRLDILIDLPKAGAFPILARLEGSGRQTGIVLATDGAQISRLAETADAAPPIDNSLEARLAALAPLAARPADVVQTIALDGGMQPYAWSMNGEYWPRTTPLMLRKGQRVEIELVNHTMMAHPIHLHGHVFQVIAIDGRPIKGAVRDTVLVPPMMGRVRIAFDANNPGRWAFHCHNLYHMMTGMMMEFRYHGIAA